MFDKPTLLNFSKLIRKLIFMLKNGIIKITLRFANKEEEQI